MAMGIKNINIASLHFFLLQVNTRQYMNTQLLMKISAVTLGVTGIILSFIPQEVSRFLSFPQSAPVVFQILGALYFGFAMLNWTAKANLIGGIYSRPVAIGNFTHFLIGGLALIKSLLSLTNGIALGVCAILYLLFAGLFGYVLFTNPVSKVKSL
jgi:energy-converting hydrogenase Eha subunit C